MPKKCVNGVYSEMTADEIAEMERLAAEMPEMPEDDVYARLARAEAMLQKLAAIAVLND